MATQFIQAQDQNVGLSTSPRGGIIAADMNPAELSNMRSKYEVGVFTFNGGFSNNKVKLNKVMSMTEEERGDAFFKTAGSTSIRTNISTSYPSFAMKMNKWGLGINMQTHAVGNLVNINSDLGLAFSGSMENDKLSGNTPISIRENMRATAATWSEINLSSSAVIFENWAHKINGGLTLKFLFPALYANAAIDQLTGNINYNAATDKYTLTGVDGAKLNMSYSESAVNDSAPKAFGGFGGIGTDLGINYQLKDTIGFYKINAGMAIKNIGSMEYKSEAGDQTFRTYTLNSAGNGSDLDLSSLDGNIDEIQDQLEAGGYLKVVEKSSTQKVKLPTVFVLYSDFRIVPKFHTSIFIQQKIGDPTDNYIIPTQNVFSITPRFTIKYFDVYSTWSSYEISGIAGGLGFRVGGFYIGSNSAITALAGGKNMDLHVGARWAFGE